MAIVTGTALSHGVARLAFLKNGQSDLRTGTGLCQKNAGGQYSKDFCYKNVVRIDLLTYIANDLGGNADNFYHRCRISPLYKSAWRREWSRHEGRSGKSGAQQHISALPSRNP
jgi:hypothetical protein